MSRKARLVLSQEQKELLLSGKPLTIRFPGGDITELELLLKPASAADRRQIAEKFRDIERKARNFGGLWPDLPDFLKRK